MADKEEAAHSMCVSLRLDASTLKVVEEERGDRTLSAAMNVRISNTLATLVEDAKEEQSND